MYKIFKLFLFIFAFLAVAFLQPFALTVVDVNAAGINSITKELMPPNPETYPEVYEKGKNLTFREAKSNIEQKAYTKLLQNKSLSTRSRVVSGSKSEKVLVIPLQFRDVKFEAKHTPEYFNTLFTASGNSVKDYYEKNSNYLSGIRGITLDVSVAPVVTSVRDMVYYGRDGLGIDDANGDIGNMAIEAVKILDAYGFDFSSFDTDRDGAIDHLVIIHAGEGQEDSRNTNTIWSCRSTLLTDYQVDGIKASAFTTVPESCQIGTICHEFGHDLGLPDLYDVDYAENGETYGVGDWDIMGAGSWNALPGKPAGSCPANLSIFSKSILGWVEPEELTRDGQYTLLNTSGNNAGFQIGINSSQKDEVYLVEYRRKQGYDAALPGEGLLVWHVDIEAVKETIGWNMINSYANRQGVELEQADLYYDLWTLANRGDDSDPYPGKTQSRNFVALPGVPFLLNYYNAPKENEVYPEYSYVEIRDINISGDTATAYYEMEKKSPGTAPELIAPAAQVFLNDLQPEFTWSVAPMATDYRVQVSEDPSFKTLTLDKYNLKYDEQGTIVEKPYTNMNRRYYTLNANYLDPDSHNEYTYAVQREEALENGKRYFWRVAPINPMTTTANIKWSEVREIYTPGYVSVTSSVYDIGEGSEDQGIIRFAINGGNFINGCLLDGSTVRLSGLPAGVSLGSVTAVNDHVIEISLQGNSTADYDEDCIVTVSLSRNIIENNQLAVDPTGTFLLRATKESLPPAPQVSFSFDGAEPGTLVGTTGQMEYSLDGGSTYSTAIENKTKLNSVELQSITASKDIRVRLKSTLRMPAGQDLVIDIIEGPSAPVIYANDEENTLAGMGPSLEYSVDQGTTWTMYTGQLPDLSGNITITIRKPATGTTMAGAGCVVNFSVESIQGPSADKSSGTYTSSISVVLTTSTSDASIYYTLDGSMPTTASKLYTAPITVSATTTVKAVAVKNGRFSSVNTYTYVIKIQTFGGGAFFIAPVSVKNPAVKESNVTKSEEGKVLETVSLDKAFVERAIELSKRDMISVDAKTGRNADKTSLRIPASIFIQSTAANKSLEILTDKAVFEIKPGTLEILADTADVELNIEYLKPAENQSTMEDMSKEANMTSEIFSLDLMIGNHKVDKFKKQITITVSYEPSKVKDVNKAGIFYYDKSGKTWVYAGGKFNSDGTVSFAAEHFSEYAAWEYTKTFRDILTHWAQYDIEVMASRQVVSGVTAEDFMPDHSITRAEFVALLVRALRIETENEPHKFTDVSADSWYKEYVNAASSTKIINGAEDEKFRPADDISREQAVAVLVRALQMKMGNIEPAGEIIPKDISDAEGWAQEAIRIAYKMDLIKGYPDGRFAPKENLTRAQAVVLIKGLMEKL